jgi:predicted DCC family thiol-disulfide oxidoreductase YuxK
VVRFLIRHDPEGRLHFAPLQSDVAQDYLRSQGLPVDDFDSLVFVPDWNDRKKGAFLLRTDGALACFAELKGPWRAVSRLRAIPAVMRDPAYRLVARTRYAIFGSYVPKPLPDPAWSRRFLDR